MFHRPYPIRGLIISLAIASLAAFVAGCPSKASAAKKLDGVYHEPGGGPITLTIKDGKATMLMGNESKTFDYKVEGNKLTISNPQEGDTVFTINDDGSLNSGLGVFQKSPT
jgi:hypothetical protein